MRRLKSGCVWEFLEYCKDTEIPTIFATWCGISAVSAVLGRDAFIDQGHYTVYPNLYIILVAGSGRCRKSTAIGVAEKFIQTVNPKINTFAQKGTPEALISALTGVDIKENVVSSPAEGIIIADELSTLLGKSSANSDLVSLLTTLWDARDSFVYHTRSRGKETIHNSCVSVLGGTTIDWIQDAISPRAIGGGLTSRIIFVYRADYEKLLLRTKMTKDKKRSEENLIYDLNEVSKIRGEFVLDEPAWKLCEEIYTDQRLNGPLEKNRYLRGYSSRRHMMLFKLAIILSASVSDSRIIKSGHVKVADRLLKMVEQEMPEVLVRIATEGAGALSSEVLSLIGKYDRIKRSQLIALMHHKMTARDLDQIVDTLSQAHKISVIKMENTAGYQIIKEPKMSQTIELDRKSFTESIIESRNNL